MHGLKLFLSSNVASQRQRDRTLTLLIYGLTLSTVATTAANAAEKITNFKDQRHSQTGTAQGPVLNLKFNFKLSPKFMKGCHLYGALRFVIKHNAL